MGQTHAEQRMSDQHLILCERVVLSTKLGDKMSRIHNVIRPGFK